MVRRAALRHRDYQLIWTGISLRPWQHGWISDPRLAHLRTDQLVPPTRTGARSASDTDSLTIARGGSAADRYSRKMQMVVTQIVNGLLFGATALLIFTGHIQPWHVYVTAVVMACVQPFRSRHERP